MSIKRNKNISRNTFLTACIVCALFIFAQCNTVTSTENFSLSGVIINSTDLPVLQAEVSIMDGTDEIASATTNPEGAFELSEVPQGSYQITVTKTGYNELSESLSVEEELSDLSFTLLGSASITGRVTDAQTGEGLSNAVVRFSEGATLSQADTTLPALETTTDFNGNYTITQGPTGQFVCVIYADGYAPIVVENLNFSSGSNSLGESTVVGDVAEGEILIVLTWGEIPYDLDTHFTGPAADNSSDRFHLYYANQNPIESVSLDVDDTSSYGPESTTVSAFFEGTYRYSVFNYSNQTEGGAEEIEDSPAKVEVYDNSGKIAEYSPPSANATSGNTWRVFEMGVNDGSLQFTALGSYDYITDDFDGSQFKINTPK